MSLRRRASACAAVLVFSLAWPTVADAQFGGLIDRAKRAVADELGDEIERTLREGVRCVVGDDACVDQARSEGRTPVMTDTDGEVLTDSDGRPITDPADVPPDVARAATPASARPGTGAWANYDFVPGDMILFVDDYANDRVGDFPRRWDLIEGNFEVVEWQDSRYVRATSGGAIAVDLPATLPERFTIEFPASVQHGNAYIRVSTSPAYHGPGNERYQGSMPTLAYSQAGILPLRTGPRVMTTRQGELRGDALVTFRIMADGDYMKVYMNEQRVANAPNAVFPRTSRIVFSVSSASNDNPILIGPLRIAAGGLDLYSRLDRDGRVATQGILFATDSDVIRPESTPTLTEIGQMLETHPDLRLTIEGHTDSLGDDAHNQDLSNRRAAAVKAYLVDTHNVDAGRLATVGLGEGQPVADNGTPEGRAQNRRVELVRQ